MLAETDFPFDCDLEHTDLDHVFDTSCPQISILTLACNLDLGHSDLGHIRDTISYGPRSEKTCLQRFANNKGTDQHAYLHSLISTFIIRLLESSISKLATDEISIF